MDSQVCYNRDMWNEELIKYWTEHYYQLVDYELNPFEKLRIFFNEAVLTGSLPHLSPYEETCDMNWEFDRALKKLGPKEAEFRRLYIDGEGGNLTLFGEFVKLLMEVSDE